MDTLKMMMAIIHLTWLVIAISIAILGLSLFNNTITASGTTDNEKKVLGAEDLPPVTKAHSNLDLGKALFKNNCATCHNRNMKDDLTGPALSGVTERWAKYPKKDLYKWIRNSQQLVKEKHPEALAVWSKWKQGTMTSFPNLSDEEIAALLAYMER